MSTAVRSTCTALEPRRLLASLAGHVWLDRDASQTPDAGESALAGWTVYLDRNDNGQFDAGEPATLTAADGGYAFEDLDAGLYGVGVAAPADHQQTTPGPQGSAEGGFDIDLRLDRGMAADVRSVFVDAAQRWESVIRADLPAFELSDGTLADDIVIDASIEYLDGEGGILGQAAPTEYRTQPHLPVRGFMEFDAADVALEMENGEFIETVIHEMAHVLGLGSMWRTLGLLAGEGSGDPRFTGGLATEQYQLLFHTDDSAGVPIEGGALGGTAGSHWAEGDFDEELMSGYADYGIDDPLSVVTVASMQDIGYTVLLAAADAWNPDERTVHRTTPLDLGAHPFTRQVELAGDDAKDGVDFGYRGHHPPRIGRFDVPAVAPIGRNIVLSASAISDADEDAIAAVTYWREANGTPGIQKGEDVFIGAKTIPRRGAFAIETATTGLDAGDQIYYAVATDAQGQSARRGAITTLVPMPERPAAPERLTVVPTSGDAAVLSWPDAEGETGYRLQVASRADFAADAILRQHTLPAETTRVHLTGLLPGERYYYRIRAYNMAGSSPYTAAATAVEQRATHELIVDDAQARFSGQWATASHEEAYGGSYHYTPDGRGAAVFGFHADAPRTSTLYVRWPANAAQADAVTLSVVSGGRMRSVLIDQSRRGNGWVYIGPFELYAGAGAVVLSAQGATGSVAADAIRFM